MSIVDGIIIAQFPVENHSEQGQFAEMSLKTKGKVTKWAIIMQFAVLERLT
jgi:hypothetical protein